MFGLSTAKLIGAAIALAAIVSFVLLAFHWKSTMTDRGEKLAAICTTTRTAAGNPKMNCGNVVVQIDELGKSVATLQAALVDQNAKVAAQGAETARQQTASAKASQVAQERAGKAEATSTRLDASSRSSAAQARPCEASAALKGVWK